jgi:2-keto-3-deoxy-L-rhamnonate aldolase RhmA
MPSIRARERLKEMLAKGHAPLGVFVSSSDAAVTEIMASVGFDFVMIDCEHGTASLQEVQNHVRAAEAGSILPFVRILENTREAIQSTLDAGAQGVFVPHIDTAEDANRAVRSSQFAPRGLRGMCPANHAGGYTLRNWSDHLKQTDRNVVVFPIIESRRAVENIAEIVAVERVDFLMFGPGDLSIDMGIDLNTEADKLKAAWHTVRDAAHRAGKSVFVPRGFGFEGGDGVYVEMDLMILHRAGLQIVAEHRATSKGAKENSRA